MTGGASISGPQGHGNKWMILSAVMLGVIMGPIDGSIVNVVLPTIANYFQTDYALVQWVPTIYLLAICSFIHPGPSRTIQWRTSRYFYERFALELSDRRSVLHAVGNRRVFCEKQQAGDTSVIHRTIRVDHFIICFDYFQ